MFAGLKSSVSGSLSAVVINLHKLTNPITEIPAAGLLLLVGKVSKHGAYRSTETIRLIRDREKGGMEVGGRRRLYTYRYTVTTRMTPALRWAAMRTIWKFHNCEGQSHMTVSTVTTFEEKGEPKQIRTEAPLLTSLTTRPNRFSVGGAGSIALVCKMVYIIHIYIYLQV